MRHLQGMVALCIAWGCAGCTHYQVLQSSLVAPPVAPPPATEQGLLDAYVGDATVTFVSRPKRAPNNDSGLWVARHVLQGALTLHASQLIGFRITGFTGLHQGAMPTTSSQLSNPGSSVNGFGMGTSLSIPYSAHHFLLSADLGVVSIPSYIEVTCLSECEGHVEFYAGRQRESVVQAVGTAGYAYRFDSSFHAQFIVTLQNHPTNHESVESSEADGDVQTGPVYVGLALSVEWLPIPWLGLIPALQWPLTRSPIQYGPILGLGVRGLLPTGAL